MSIFCSRVFLCSIGISATLVAIPEDEFEDVNDRLINAHAPLVSKKLGAKLELKEIWQDFGGAFKVDSAFKTLGENRFVITLTGQVAQHPFMNMDGYAIVACHELGHILSDGPKQKSRALTRWSSVEEEADYYATNECMWRYVESIGARHVMLHTNRLSVQQCEQNYGNDGKEFLGCMRIMSGIIAMQNYFNSTSSRNNPVSIYSYDPIVVNKTVEKYASDQCRIDTMVAGLFNRARPKCYYAE